VTGSKGGCKRHNSATRRSKNSERKQTKFCAWKTQIKKKKKRGGGILRWEKGEKRQNVDTSIAISGG